MLFVCATKDPPYAIAAPDPEQAGPLRVIAALRTMTCREPDMEALTGFYDSWMLEIRTAAADCLR